MAMESSGPIVEYLREDKLYRLGRYESILRSTQGVMDEILKFCNQEFDSYDREAHREYLAKVGYCVSPFYLDPHWRAHHGYKLRNKLTRKNLFFTRDKLLIKKANPLVDYHDNRVCKAKTKVQEWDEQQKQEREMKEQALVQYKANAKARAFPAALFM